MDNLNLDELDNNEEDNLNSNNDSVNQFQSININNETEEPIQNKFEVAVTNPITFEVSKISKHQNNNFQITLLILFKHEQYTITFLLSDFQNYIQSIQNLKYTFIPSIEIINSSSVSVIKEKLQSMLKYLSIRYDVLNNEISKIFFKFCNIHSQPSLKQLIGGSNLEILYRFKINSEDQTLNYDFTASDVAYDTRSGLLMLSFEDRSLLSTVGKFWSIIDSEILGNIAIYQRLFDNNNKPYFTKKIFKCFDVRVSTINSNYDANSIFVGFENGTVHCFTIYIVGDNLLSIIEGIKFKYFTNRICAFAFLGEYTFIAGTENKIMITKFGDEHKRDIEVIVNASLKKRVEGKGHIENILIEPENKKLYVITTTRLILIYNIITSKDQGEKEISIAFNSQIEAIDNIQNVYVKPNSIFISTCNKIQFINTSKKDINNNYIQNILCLDGSNDPKLSFSAQYINISINNSIESIVYFSQMQIFILGLSNGTLMSISAETLEILYSRKISEASLIRIMLLEENYVIIVGDAKGITHFIQIGSI